MPTSLTAAADDSGRRLDRILRKALPDTPLSAIHRQLRQGAVLVDGKAANSFPKITLTDAFGVTADMVDAHYNYGF